MTSATDVHLPFNDEGAGNMDTLLTFTEDERTARVALAVIAEPGDATMGHVLALHGAVAAVTMLADDDPVPGIDHVEAQLWRKRLMPRVELRLVQEAIERTEQDGLGILIPGDSNYPVSLNDLGYRAPYVLWVKGAESLLATSVGERFTITGARAATSYGIHVASELASDLARDEKVLVAGGAYGIDGAVHQAALNAAGHTVAVMAGGVDRPYPSGHRNLLESVGDLGALVSEMPPGATPTRWRFLARARIEAALSGSTTIVEAGYRSGSLLMAEQARSLHRPVGAVPGPVTSAASAGPHRLLAEDVARVVTSADDIRALSEKPQSLEQKPQLSGDVLGVERGSRSVSDSRLAHRHL